MVQKIIDGYCRLTSAISVICLGLMVLMVFGNVVLRYGFNSGISVSEEMSRWLFLWLVFLGAAIAVREQGHMGTDMLIVKFPPKVRQAAHVVSLLLMLWVTWLMFQGSVAQTRINWDVEAPVTGFSTAWIFGAGVVFAVTTGVMLLSDLSYALRGKKTLAQIAGEEAVRLQELAERNPNAVHATTAIKATTAKSE